MRIDIIGQRFGRLLVTGPVGSGALMKWACKCDCDNTIETRSKNLRSGSSKSCGCLHREIVGNHSIDRIDNDGNYEPGNCQWSTTSEQARNKRTTRMITIDGTTRCIADWADALGVPRNRIRHRLNNGWSDRDAVLTPAIERGQRHRGH
jgi:hypothetical protein